MFDLDQTRLHRLLTAHHELGHAVVFQALGITVTGVEVINEAHGVTTTDSDDPFATPEQTRAYLVGALAGREADLRWFDVYGYDGFDESSCADDLAYFRKHRRHEFVRDIPDSEFRSEARRLVRAHWGRITRLAPRLAERGAIAV